jgi:hypothetical protein
VSWSSKVADHVTELRRLGLAAYLVCYPNPVLVHRFGAPTGTPPPRPRFRTDLLSRPAATNVLFGGAEDLAVAVHPVKKRPGNAYEDAVMLGRASINDIVLPYGDLSKLHAYFSHPAGEGWFVADAGSTNGSWLGQEQLAPNRPMPLGERNELAFGENAFELLTPAAFGGLLEALAVAVPP